MSGDPLTGQEPDRGPLVLLVIWILTPLALLTAVLRIVTRARKRRCGWDDIFMMLAMLCFLGWSTTLTLYAKRGGLMHIQDVAKTGPDNIATVLLLNWLSQPFGIIGVAAGKISVSALLLSIIRMTDLKWHRRFLWSIPIILTAVIGIACSVLTFAQCSPAAALWDKRYVILHFVFALILRPKYVSNAGQQSLTPLAFYLAFNTIVDASLAVVPATIFWNLNSTTTEKAQLSIVFGFNILTSVCSGIKTQYLIELANRQDQTWATYDIFVWVTGELFLMIVCGSIPTLHPVFGWVRSTASSVKSRVTSSSPRRDRTEQTTDVEMGRMAHMSGNGTTKTTIGRSRILGDGSEDHLVEEKTLPAHGVRVDVAYDVRTDKVSRFDYS
ncbi:integral membrane protein [Drechmeria coniospora]|uniref:Integral membrane protein n=1 Tax=Drechmeria coniospora TaxID=98403 RepID=A0A151GHJ5_DRECN|nr:integral membrane protein [Drechmeria coniospora]KYK56548.1 integral membrane protein [Drechmeria coniospora]